VKCPEFQDIWSVGRAEATNGAESSTSGTRPRDSGYEVSGTYGENELIEPLHIAADARGERRRGRRLVELSA